MAFSTVFGGYVILSRFPNILAYPLLYIDYMALSAKHYNKRDIDVHCSKDDIIFGGDVVLSGFPSILAYSLLYIDYMALSGLHYN